MFKSINSKLVAIALAFFLSAASADDSYLDPPTKYSSGKPLAVVWIHGMSCNPVAYDPLAI